ncbi:hypothetical protein [Roseivivax sediminis]|uniref:Secreted protein n=1 Tax=Roseivivax sediminis TaxID=936889 RepID=A0A1I2E8G7_9RHOB|nr:hypothetical protein [Roseivivax sediminis]SFE89284.1 hypothetical protein SAMN04515678_12129 [Roseivivax sediminis]
MTMLARCLSIMLLGAMILAGSLAPAHDVVMGGAIGVPAHASDHGGHSPDETGRTGTPEPCEICDALFGDCVASFCHPDLIVENRGAPTEGAKVLHHSSTAPNRPGMIAEVQHPPPRHLLQETQTSFPQEIT